MRTGLIAPLLIIAASCGGAAVRPATNSQAEAPALVSLAELQDKGAPYDGKRITVEGFVQEVVDGRYFRMLQGGPSTDKQGNPIIICAGFTDIPLTALKSDRRGELASRLRGIQSRTKDKTGLLIRATGIFTLNRNPQDPDRLPDIVSLPHQPMPALNVGIGVLKSPSIEITDTRCKPRYYFPSGAYDQ